MAFLLALPVPLLSPCEAGLAFLMSMFPAQVPFTVWAVLRDRTDICAAVGTWCSVLGSVASSTALTCAPREERWVDRFPVSASPGGGSLTARGLSHAGPDHPLSPLMTDHKKCGDRAGVVA